MAIKNSPVQHLGIIMDGNRRWANDRGLPSVYGHKKGVDALERAGDLCISREIKYLTVWAFSTENWSRPKKEISYLMKLMKHVAETKVSVFMKQGVRLNVIGRLKQLPAETREAIERAIEKTKKNTRVVMNVAINYGGRAEIVDAVKTLVAKKINPEKITEKFLNSFFYLPEIPEPDLIIRTGGQVRTSGFLPWESEYSEWFFTKTKWPDFGAKELDAALADYSERQRNFGK